MFTGIIEELAKVEKVTQLGENIGLELSSRLSSGLKIGQSLAHDGVCLTIEKVEADRYQVSLIPETLRKTSLGSLEPGDLLNLERPLRAGQFIDGHFVQGHVDSTGEVVEIKEIDKSSQGEKKITIACPAIYKDLLVPKGSIALHGISLTLAGLGEKKEARQALFTVCIIPHTYKNTNASRWQKGSILNVEFDILGKYVRNMME